MADKLEAALALAERGFKIFPIKPLAKSPPLIQDWPANATNDRAIVDTLWRQWPDANIGIHCDGLIVLDVDVAKGGKETLQFLEMTYGLDRTLRSITPSGGYHIFYKGRNVGNGVNVLGAGIDIRSHGGYVVAPGSTLPTGRYRFEADVEIATAPEWLVHKLSKSPGSEQAKNVTVEDASDEAVNRASQWLTLQPPAIEGQGGDHHTFATICGLRDFGISAEQAALLIAEWNVRCQPPWDEHDLITKIRNAYKYAENEPGLKAVTADDFPIESTTNAPIQKPVNAPRRLAEIVKVATAGPGYLIKGLLNRGSQAVAYGAPGEGKTFIALDIAYHVAAGKEWMGRRVHQGLVLYLAYEGVGGFVARSMALQRYYGDADVPLYIHSADYNLRDIAGRHGLRDALATLPEKPILVVIDTLARAMKGGDENSAQDMGALMDAVGALSVSTGACVLLIHHCGKNKDGGARGSSALLGAIDTELEIDSQEIISTKQRDIELSEPIGFQLKPIVVGIDEDNDTVTSCIVEPKKIIKHTIRLTGNVQRAFEVLCELRPDNSPIHENEWREACAEFLPDRRNAMFDLKRALLRANMIDIDLKTGMVIRRIE